MSHHMKKEIKLVNKVKRLLRRLGMPRWLHHYGPKTYEFYEHFAALLIRFFCKLSYRRVKQLLELLGIRCPSKSALQYTAKNLGAGFWQKVLKITSSNAYLVAIDSTCLARVNPSYYYLKRIDGKMPKVPVMLSAAFDTAKKRFCAAKVRVIRVHDIKDAKYLLEHSKPKILVADKAYDAEWLHGFCKEHGIKPFIPVREWGKPKHRNMGLRMKSIKKFNFKAYHRRSLIESGFSSVKRKFGSSVSSKKARTIRTEVYGRLVCHNIFSWIFGLLGQSRLTGKLHLFQNFYSQ